MSAKIATGFNIGAVARLTGIARERIRIWERRYGVVVPHRDAANNRLYSQDDIDRLIVIRRLVDAGHAIGQIANLSRSELEARQPSRMLLPGPAALPATALVFGPEAAALAQHLRRWGVPEVAVASHLNDALQHSRAAAVDLVIAACPTLIGQDSAGLLQLRRALPDAALLLVFRFAPQRLLEQLARLGIRTIRAPLEAADLALPAPDTATAPGTPAALGTSVAPDYRTRQFDAAELERLAALEGTVDCDCPQHLANLVRDLQAFEDYTLTCEVSSPADAALHREVYAVIARARALTEDALGIIAAEEGIALGGH
jgi:DNA-binding transcriptional MerR regulator